MYSLQDCKEICLNHAYGKGCWKYFSLPIWKILLVTSLGMKSTNHIYLLRKFWYFLDDLPPDYTEVELNPPEVGDKYQRFE